MQQRAQRAVAEVSADVASYGGIMKQRPGFGPCSVGPSRPSCCERASCQAWLLAHPHLEPPRARPSAPTRVLLRKHLGVKVEKVFESVSFCLFSQRRAGLFDC